MALILCFLPIVLVVLLFSLVFKIKLTHQLLAILLGLVAVLPIAIIQFVIPDIMILKQYPLFYSLLKSLILYGFIEEAIKAGILSFAPHKNYDVFKFLLISFVFGISLGCFETAVYFFDHLQMAHARGASLMYSPIFTRIFTSDIIHMTCTGLCGLFIFSIRQKKTKVSPFIIAILLHGLYDFFAGFTNYLHWFSIVVLLLAIAECRIKYVSLQNNEE